MPELIANYTSYVTVAVRKEATQLAGEATQWMKDNASWQDDTERARAGLRAFVVGAKEEQRMYKSGLRDAHQQDAQTLREMNRRRASSSDLSIRNAPRLKSLPSGTSAVEAFNRDFNKGQIPVVEIKFQHNPRISYPVWLEVANQGRYSIIDKAIAHFSPKMMRKVQRIANLPQSKGMNLYTPGISPSEAFEAHVARETAATGKQYNPFSPKVQNRRQERRDYRRDYNKRKKAQQEAQAIEEGSDAATQVSENQARAAASTYNSKQSEAASLVQTFRPSTPAARQPARQRDFSQVPKLNVNRGR